MKEKNKGSLFKIKSLPHRTILFFSLCFIKEGESLQKDRKKFRQETLENRIDHHPGVKLKVRQTRDLQCFLRCSSFILVI